MRLLRTWYGILHDELWHNNDNNDNNKSTYRWFLYLNSPFVYFLCRQGYPEDFHRANQSAYSEYYADYAKHYDYAGMNH